MNNFDILPSPSDLLSLSCSDLSTCFQSIYNILFMILLGLAFFWFLFGAFEYLLSASGYYSIQKAKSRMISAILAVVIVLIIPPILYLIDPNIFNITLKIPNVTISPPGKKEFKPLPGYAPAIGSPNASELLKEFKPNCQIKIPSGPCAERHLKKYLITNKLINTSSMSEQNKLLRKLSLICHYSSYGNIYLGTSRVNTCLDQKPFSGGLLNINMAAVEFSGQIVENKIFFFFWPITVTTTVYCKPGEIFNFLTPPNSANIINTIPIFDKNLQQFLCEVKNISLYQKCFTILSNPDDHFKIAYRISEGWTNFSSWPIWEKGLKKCFP